jgi:dTDP-4-dehydrorhamnose reductase
MTGAFSMDNAKTQVLITGTTGLVGHRLVEYLKSSTIWEIIGTSRSAGDYVDHIVDLTDMDSVNDLGNNVPADIVIHTAAISKTDVCEKNQEDCYAANVTSTKNLASAYKNAKIIYFSTYAVYNTPEGKCDETVPVTATNYYIQTKMLSEQLLERSPRAIIFRPSVIFGFTPFERASKNYFMQLLENIRDKKVTRSPVDHFFNPIHVDIVAEIVKIAIDRDIQGIFNLGSNEDISKFEFNKKILQKFYFEERYLEGINSHSLEVTRPNNGTISSRRIQESLGFRIPNLDLMIETLFQSTRGYSMIRE